MTDEEVAPASKKTPLAIIFVTVFIDLLGFGIVLPLLPRYADAFGASRLQLGMLMASFSAMQLVFAPVWGGLSDRIGRRPVLLIGLAGSTISYAMFGYATTLGATGTMLGLTVLPWLFITRIGAGIAGATIPTAQAYIADCTSRENRTKGMALIGAAFGIGFTFGPLIGAAFVSDEVNGAPSPMAGYVAAILSGCAFLWALVRLPESLKAGESERAGKFHLKHIGAAFGDAAIGMVLLTIFVTTCAFAQFESTLSMLTKVLDVPDQKNFLIFAYVGFILTLSQGFIVRRLSTTLEPKVLALGGTAVMIVGLLLIGFAGKNGSVTLLFVVLPIAVIGFSAVTPSLQALLSLRTAAEKQGEILGLGQSMSALARIAGPVIGMRMFHKLHVEWPYWVGAAMMGVGLVLVALQRGGEGKVAEEVAPEVADASE
ncbi:MAG: MFS transporter [Planctomycetales bacterium]|jgi:DHA1 family tetracycline resistance protein-like MFS transporter